METTGTRQVALNRASVAFAFAQVGKDNDKYVAYVRRLPSLIQTNGLGAALAFVFAKAKFGGDKRGNDAKAYELIYQQLREWLFAHSPIRDELLAVRDRVQRENANLYKDEKEREQQLFIDTLISLDADTYRATTRETLAFLQWLRRFAEGLNPRGVEAAEGLTED
ncbi:MAG: type III-B CRISPR module-associated protein Cmr5 [Calditerricola sp.]|nr:type III-B CRISPR module-associated protein Cmr5 [Calditerricola sp.]